MASLTGSRFLFFTTSPRTPERMIPEINLLKNNYEGKEWNKRTQANFMKDLVETEHFQGKGPKDLAFAGRDRINRAPQSLGFINLKPDIRLTDAGNNLLNHRRKEEVFLRQLLKFQLPSPYHTISKSEDNIFWVKPYLEIFRLIYTLGSLSFDELMLFGLQLTDYRRFDEIVVKIKTYRKKKAVTKHSYKKFRMLVLTDIVLDLFDENITSGNTRLRESKDSSIENFVKTKSHTMRDYADACVRYLRSTGLIHISQRGKSLSIIPERIPSIEHILASITRDPVHHNNVKKYKDYLFNGNLPELYTDNREALVEQIEALEPLYTKEVLEKNTTVKLKDMVFDILENRKNDIINQQVSDIKERKKYDDIMTTFKDIKDRSLYDTPLILEWNVWRAMTMMNGGKIMSNVKLDDEGEPMSTAPGNMADILCDYGTFGLTVEVTMQSGQRQYEMEGEPVSRHLAKFKGEISKPAYCLFIAPIINDAIISHFYALHRINISYYGGTSIIVPLELSVFEEMVRASYQANTIPTPINVESLFKYSANIVNHVHNEKEWYQKIREKALAWLD